MRKLFLATVALTGMLIAYYQILSFKDYSPSIIDQIQENNLEEAPLESSTLKIIKSINEQKNIVKTLQNREFSIKLYQNNMKFNAKAMFYYEKPKLFHMEVWHAITGKEVEIGSNSEYFWFYSKRIDPPSLYYAKHTDSHLTNLKAPLHPEWMMQSLNVDQIDVSKITKILKTSNTICVVQSAPESIGSNFIIKTVIEESTKFVKAKALCDSGDNVVCETIYSDQTIEIIWKQERIRMILDMSKNIQNKSISKDFWAFPNYRYKINMAET